MTLPLQNDSRFRLPTALDGDRFAILTRKLAHRFGRRVALDDVSLQAPEGAVYVLVGPNGAGKSTLLRSVLNLTRPEGGSVQALGMDVARNGPAVRAAAGYVPEGPDAARRWMKGGRLARHYAAYHRDWDASYFDRLARMLDLRLERPLGRLSKGEARRLQLAVALARRPRLLLLDEPTDGLDPVARDDVLGLLAEHLADTGCTILLSTHLVHEVDRIADHVGVLKNGKLLAQVSRERLQEDLRVYRAEGPEGWVGPADVPGAVIARAAVGREIQWTVWGSERAVAAALADAGGEVRDVSRIPLDQAVLALLRADTP